MHSLGSDWHADVHGTTVLEVCVDGFNEWPLESFKLIHPDCNAAEKAELQRDLWNVRVCCVPPTDGLTIKFRDMHTSMEELGVDESAQRLHDLANATPITNAPSEYKLGRIRKHAWSRGGRNACAATIATNHSLAEWRAAYVTAKVAFSNSLGARRLPYELHKKDGKIKKTAKFLKSHKLVRYRRFVNQKSGVGITLSDLAAIWGAMDEGEKMSMLVTGKAAKVQTTRMTQRRLCHRLRVQKHPCSSALVIGQCRPRSPRLFRRMSQSCARSGAL